VDALHRALRKWTTGHAEVTAEDLYSELALGVEQRNLAPAPPPPAPFFPTRIPVATSLEGDLTAATPESVFFLTAEPGAGKTSVLSWLANRRDDYPFTGKIGLRFFCFEPIRPESPFIAPDASRVQPADLWFSLLSQLREGLRGRLRELCVPLRNDLLTWQEARAHVIRLASTLGAELARPFVIVIDGIDHAARAAQTMPQQAAEFLASLPGPDELRGKSIRLLIAGQPAASYSTQYPAWLIDSHPEVRKIELPGLQADDVRSLVQAISSRIPTEQHEAVVRLIQQVAKGNTLATVFAVTEAENVSSVDELASQLSDRRLSDGLAAYYSSIWQHALRGLADLAEGVGACLVASISLARRAVTPEFLAAAFCEWDRPVGWWAAVLEDIGPLLTAGPDGFRIRHNDVRVFLAGRFATLPVTRRKRVASQLADHFRRENCDRVAAHLQLLDLLKLAERPDDFSRAFDVGWVFEAGALGIETAQLLAECEAAVQGLAQLKEWPLVVSVACAAQTLERLIDARDYADYAAHDRDELPPFLPSEARVHPLSQWSLQHLRSLVHDAKRLVEANERPRALALLRRWLEGLDIGQVAARLGDGLADQFQVHGRGAQLSGEAVSVFETLGRVCGRLSWVLPLGQKAGSLYASSVLAFERGYVAVMLESEAAMLSELFAAYRPRYLRSWEGALRGLARSRRWVMVREVLADLQPHRLSLTSHLRAEITAWALRSGAVEDEPAWLNPLSEPASGIDPKQVSIHDEKNEIAPYLSIAYSLGWTRVGMDGRDVAAVVCQQLAPRWLRDREPAVLAIVRASALLGRVDCAYARGGDEEVRRLVTPAQIQEVLGSLWGPVVTGNIHFRQRDTAADLARSIAEVCGRLGREHDVAALEQATVFAAEFPVDARQPALWSVLRRHAKRDLLRQWIVNWIGEEGKAWRLSHEDVHSIVRPLLPLAEEVGEMALAARAAKRLRGLLIGYRGHKDYGFAHILEWSEAASRAIPALWRTVGWKVWHLCDLCEQRDGDNLLRGALRTSVSAAALGCGPGDWWALVQATVSLGLGGQWYHRTGQQLIEGVIEVVDSGRSLPCGDLPVIWSLGLAFSYWHDERDNSVLRRFREALSRVPGTAFERQPLLDTLARTTRSSSLDDLTANKEEGPSHVLEDEPAKAATPSPVTQETARDTPILPSIAATQVRALASSSSGDRDSQIDAVLIAIGAEIVADWFHADPNVLSSLEEIARAVTDGQLWLIAEAIAKGMDRSRSYGIYGVYPNLFRLALVRAELRGAGELAAGLDPQLEMHARWAGSEGPGNYDWPPPPSVEAGLTWQAVAVRLLGLLLTSNSSDVLTATLESVHALAAARHTAIAELFAACTTEWQRHWLLSAAESWAALHPSGVSAGRPLLDLLLIEGSLHERLQCWLVLSKLTETTGGDGSGFPLPARTGNLPQGSLIVPGGVLHSPGVRHGHARFGDAYSSAHRVLDSLRALGWDFRWLEAEIGELLSEVPAGASSPEQDGLRRRNDITCHDLRAETAVGGAILRTLAVGTCDQADVPLLAQGLLDGDDAWLQRSPPRRASASPLWPPSPGYGAEEPREKEVQASLRSLAVSLDMAPGWRTFTARIFYCTRKRDYVLDLWYEQCLIDGLLTCGDRPSCPSGRTFLWSMDDFFEPPARGGRFVSGFFVGGGHRLGHDFLNIQPSRAWRELLGWAIAPADPLTWLLGEEPVARYERLHGPLQSEADAPNQRQPVIDRWVITDGAFTKVQNAVGLLRLREDFSSDDFE
jgi:hypothetical protein